MFYGPSGWSIEWQKDKKFWQLSNERIPGRLFLLTVRPFGRPVLHWGTVFSRYKTHHFM